MTLDVLMSGFRFHDLSTDAMPKAIGETSRVLKPSGFVFMLDTSQDHDGAMRAH